MIHIIKYVYSILKVGRKRGRARPGKKKMLTVLIRKVNLSLMENVGSEQRLGGGKGASQVDTWVNVFWAQRSVTADSLRREGAWFALRTATVSVWLEWR